VDRGLRKTRTKEIGEQIAAIDGGTTARMAR
jgi:hypothetical protein